MTGDGRPNHQSARGARSARAVLFGTAGLLIVIVLIAPPESFAQSAATTRPAFEVASIKARNSVGGGAGSIRQINPDGLTYTDRNLLEYIMLAYGVEAYRVNYGPAISLADRYDIIAKAAGPVPPSQVKLMLQSLLEDRFKLVIHKETKALRVYALTLAKGGPRFKASEGDGELASALKNGSLQYTRASMTYLAELLSSLPSLSRPVVDQTGLDGVYDFSMTLFDPAPPNSEIAPKTDLFRQVDNGLSVSLKELGLKVESQKRPVEFLIIDHVEKPSAN